MTAYDAIADAGAAAAMMLEIKDPAELAIVERCVPHAVVALALLMVETDPEYAPRWAAAGDDWTARGAVLHDALLFLLTPETMTADRPLFHGPPLSIYVLDKTGELGEIS